MVKAFAFAVPGDLDTPTGGYAYDKRMVAELTALGWQVDVLNIGEGFPRPGAETKRKAEAMLAAVPAGRPIVVDGLAFGVMPEIAARLRETHPLIALVHHPLALETGTTGEDAVMLKESERAALACTRAVIANSPMTARTLVADYGVAAGSITVAPPGTDRPATALGPMASLRGPVELLSVGAIVPRKGYDVLVAALATLADLSWRLSIVGDGRDPATAAQLKAQVASAGLADRIVFEGAVARGELGALYASADLFVLASHYEGFGMAYAEAIAHGLPVVGTTAGAIPDTVSPAAGVLVAPGDAVALAAALRRLIGDGMERTRLAAGARAAAEELPTWSGSAKLFSAAIERVA